jgi:hypothetical protein
LINKVNGPPKLTLINASKGMEHNPGASSGSGLSYQGPQDQETDQESKEQGDEKTPKLAIVSELEKSGMTEVVINFYENKNSDPTTQAAGLTTKYQSDHSRTKGLLLNKKAE